MTEANPEPRIAYITWVYPQQTLSPTQIQAWTKLFTAGPKHWHWCIYNQSGEPITVKLPPNTQVQEVATELNWPSYLTRLELEESIWVLCDLREEIQDKKAWLAFVDRVIKIDPNIQKPILLVNGLRVQGNAPSWITAVSRLKAWFFNVVLDFQMPVAPGWSGFRLIRHRNLFRFFFGVQFHDPYSGHKALHRQILRQFPVDSAGDLGWVELLAKANFVGTLMDEMPLPVNRLEQRDNPHWSGFSWKAFQPLFSKPRFWNPKQPTIHPEDSKSAPQPEAESSELVSDSPRVEPQVLTENPKSDSESTS